ncbi:GLIPR1-like protein 1 [Ylistrum balloti]|uniref:GLIPR1-like protein 1 n=1 Tax=Ylistrum balloti TaxID=509963 RepID=UPI0029059D44|nr:GLIPR1-like protein 1 [Ylistrum balloti]
MEPGNPEDIPDGSGAVLVASVYPEVFCLDARAIETVLVTHNTFRRNFANGVYGTNAANMKEMVWSRTLQLQAEQALDCSLAGSLHTDPYDIYTNVGVSERGYISNILDSWMSEKQHFIPQLQTCIRLHKCKRFLTMIHAGHHEVGCAHTRQCRVRNVRVNLLVCKYGISEDPIVPAFKTGAPCTKCDGTMSFCENGLCVPCLQTDRNCDCRKTCYRESIGDGSLDNNTCTCTCAYGLGPNCDEDCVNPEMYVDWDICSEVREQDCQSDSLEEREILRKMCPAQCACRRHPEASMRHNDAGLSANHRA